MNAQLKTTSAFARKLNGAALSAVIRQRLGSDCLVRLSQITDALNSLAPSSARKGSWVGYETEEGAFFMAPTAPQRIQVPAYGMDVTLSAEAAGALASLYAYEQIGALTLASRYVTLRDRLLAYIRKMPESSAIMACAGIA